MELKRALELHTEYAGNAGVIRVDKDEYICLNELNSFFPNKRISDWMRTDETKTFIEIVEKTIIAGKCGIIARRGKSGGTWAHHLIAFEFAMWLSPEFKIKVYQEYINGTQNKKDWNIKRIMAANNYKIMCEAIHNDHEKPCQHHYTNEALMINEIVFGVRESAVRDSASEEILDVISLLESYNAGFIEAGMDYQTRKQTIKMIHEKKTVKGITE